MLDESFERAPHHPVAILPENGEDLAARQGLKNKVSKIASRAGIVCETSHPYRQLTFGWGGEDKTDSYRQVEFPPVCREDRPAQPGQEKNVSQFAPGQLVFEWFECPPTATDN